MIQEHNNKIPNKRRKKNPTPTVSFTIIGTSVELIKLVTFSIKLSLIQAIFTNPNQHQQSEFLLFHFSSSAPLDPGEVLTDDDTTTSSCFSTFINVNFS